jgi:hypothetical protein
MNFNSRPPSTKVSQKAFSNFRSSHLNTDRSNTLYRVHEVSPLHAIKACESADTELEEAECSALGSGQFTSKESASGTN